MTHISDDALKPHEDFQWLPVMGRSAKSRYEELQKEAGEALEKLVDAARDESFSGILEIETWHAFK